MPRINQLVDATSGHPRISFLDAFQGYHQIPLALEDQEKTAFITPTGNYHYKDVVQSEKCRVHLSKDDDENVQAAVGQEHRNLCR